MQIIYVKIILQKTPTHTCFGPYLSIIREHKNQLLEVSVLPTCIYEGWNFNSGNYLFTTDTK